MAQQRDVPTSVFKGKQLEFECFGLYADLVSASCQELYHHLSDDHNRPLLAAHPAAPLCTTTTLEARVPWLMLAPALFQLSDRQRGRLANRHHVAHAHLLPIANQRTQLTQSTAWVRVAVRSDAKPHICILFFYKIYLYFSL